MQSNYLEGGFLFFGQASLIQQNRAAISSFVILVLIKHVLPIDGRVVNCLDLVICGMLRALISERMQLP